MNLLNKKPSDPQVELLKTQAIIDLKKIEAQSTAKESASRFIGKAAIPVILILVIVGVISSAFLPPESLPAVIGLVSTAVMALITMLAGITGTADKEEKPEYAIINNLIKSLEGEAKEPMNVVVDKEKVVVNKGENTLASSRPQSK